MRLQLIFVHVWKTGGMALGEAIDEAFTPEAVLHDQEDLADPIAQFNIDPDGYLRRHHEAGYGPLEGKVAVMGHFWVRKYDPVQADIRATILRDPIERALSHYYYWLAFAQTQSPVLRYVVDNKLTFEEFARLPLIRWTYTRVFFRDTDMGRFDYIGRHEDVAKDWSGALEGLGIDAGLPPRRVNETNAWIDGYNEAREAILGDRVKMGALRDVFADDFRFYERYAGASAS